MGLNNSKSIKFGGNDNLITNFNDLKNTENKLTEFLNSTGFISSGVQDFDSFVDKVKHDTNPVTKRLDNNGKNEAINGIREYLNEGIGIKNVSSLKDDEVINIGYNYLNNINKSILKYMDEDINNLNSNIGSLSNMHKLLSTSFLNLPDKNTLNDNAVELMNKTINLIDQQKNYISVIKNSDELNNLHNKFSNSYKYVGELEKGILKFMNDVADTTSNINNFRNIKKLYDDNKINLNTETIKQMNNLTSNLKSNPSFDSVSSYIIGMYDLIEKNKNNSYEGGGNKSKKRINNRLLLNKNWDTLSTVKSILKNGKKSYSGGTKQIIPVYGGDTLQNVLNNKLTNLTIDKNKEIIKSAETLSDKLNFLAATLSSLSPEFKNLDVVQLNDLEKIFKKFLYFNTFKYKNMFLILLDYFIDVQSTYIKQDFLLKINTLITLTEKGSSILSKLKDVSTKLTEIINYINKSSSDFKSRYDLSRPTIEDKTTYRPHDDNMQLSNRGPIDAYDNKIYIDYDDLPDLTVVSTYIIKSITQLLYTIRLQIYYKQLATTSNNFNKEYEKLVGMSIGAEIDKIKQDYTAIMNKIKEFEMNGSSAEFKEDKSIELNYPITVIPIPIYVEEKGIKYEYIEIKKIFMYLPTTPPSTEKECNIRDHRAWGRTESTWVDDETLRGISLQNTPIEGENLRNMLTNYKEFFTNYYESVIGLYMASQAI